MSCAITPSQLNAALAAMTPAQLVVWQALQPAQSGGATPAATDTVAGKVALATGANHPQPTNDTDAATPAYVAAAIAGLSSGTVAAATDVVQGKVALATGSNHPQPTNDTDAATPAYVAAAIAAIPPGSVAVATDTVVGAVSLAVAANYPSASNTEATTPAYVAAAIAAIPPGSVATATDTVAGAVSLAVAANYPSASDTEATTPAYVNAVVAAANNDNVYNRNGRNLGVASGAMGRLINNISDMNIAFVGDSTTLGIGSGNNGNSTIDQRFGAAPEQCARWFSAQTGLNVSTNSWFGDGFVGAAGLAAFDPRLAVGADWTSSTTFTGGGYALQDVAAPSGNTELSFTFPDATNTFEVYCVISAGYGDVIVLDNGAFNTSFSEAGTLAVGKIIATRATATTNRWGLIKGSATDSATVKIYGVKAFDSTKKQAHFINMGASGSRMNHWVADTTAVGFVNAIVPMAVDLFFVQLGINDWANATSVAAFTADLQTMVTKMRLNSDVVLVSPIPSSVGTAADATQALYVAAIKEVARANNLVFLDLYGRLGPQAANPGRNFYYDGQHATRQGYSDVARFMCREVLLEN